MTDDKIKAVIATLSVDLDRAESVLGLAHNEDEPARKIFQILRFYSVVAKITSDVRDVVRKLDPTMELFATDLTQQQMIDWIRVRLRGGL